MSNESNPAPPPAKPGHFKTVVAWVCGPIVLVQVILLALSAVDFYRTVRDAQNGKRTYVSSARLLVGGMDANPKQENGTPIADEFYGTMMELLQSRNVTDGARHRVHALHPDLPNCEPKLKAGRMPGTRILVLQSWCEDPAFAQAFLDAVMDEFIAMRREMTGATSEEKVNAIQDELVRLEKDMQHAEERQRAAKQSGASAEELDKLKSDLERTKRSYERLTDMLRNIDTQPKVVHLITILERASPGIVVRPSFSFSNLFK